MGQKVHPNGIRLGIVKPWNSTWFANTKEFADNLDSDFKVRQYLTKELAKASVSRIVIERPAKSIRVTIHTARPGIVIGKKGEDVEKLRKVVADIAGVPAQCGSSKARSWVVWLLLNNRKNRLLSLKSSSVKAVNKERR